MTLLITPPSTSLRADGALVEHPPSHCPSGHPTTPGMVNVGHVRCACQGLGGGHRTYRCEQPDPWAPAAERCNAVTYAPPCAMIVA